MWDERYSAPDLAWGTEPNRRLVAEVGALPPGRALDLGAGEGRNAVWLASIGWTVTAVDFSRAGLERASAMADDADVAVELVLADVAEYVPQPAAYDLVVLIYLQLPGAPLAEVVGRAASAVAPGGTFLLIAHDVDNLTRGFGGPKDPAVLTDVAVVTAALGDLVVDHAGQVDRVVSVADGDRVAIDALVRAHRDPL